MFKIDASDMHKTMVNLDQNVIYHQTIIAADDIKNKTEEMTFPLVPLDLGYLEGGFKASVKSYPPLLQMDMIYSAIDNSGYDYAEIQHEVSFRHPKKGQKKYLMVGFGRIRVDDIWASYLSRVL